VKIKNGSVLYPEIVTAEILTALKLKDKYKIPEIAEARKCLDFNDKKLVTKLSLSRIESLAKIKELIDDLLQEKKHLEVVGDYLKVFLESEKELKELRENKRENFVS
jgi:hypothetical protein